MRKFERIYGLDVAATLYPLLRECGTEEFRYVNDAAAFALGECLGGVADDAERVVALTLGTGVGSGFVAGRRLVTSGDEVPANGWVYCLPFEGGIVDEAFSTRWVCGRYRELTGQEISGAAKLPERHAGKTPRHGACSTNTGSGWRHSQPRGGAASAPTCWCSAGISRGPTRCSGQPWNAGSKPSGHRIRIGPPARPDHAALIGAASLFI